MTADVVYLPKPSGRRRTPKNPAVAEHPFAEAMARLAPLLRDYDREELFRVMFRLSMRELREAMYSLNASVMDPDDFRGGITEDRRAAVEESARRLVASLG